MLDLTSLPAWSAPQMAYLILSVAIAGFVRGYSGFGVSLASVPMLTVVLDPVDAIPLALVYEIALTLGFLPSSFGLVQWQTLRWLVAGAVVGTPIGIYVLSSIPPEPMRLALSLILLSSVILTWRSPSGTSWHLTRPATVSVGAISGVLSGGTAMSGPPIVVYFLASPTSPAASRASMMMFFFFSASIALALGLGAGLYPQHTFALAIASIPALLLGAALGAFFFRRSKAIAYRRVALLMLAAIGLFAFGNATIHYLA